MEKEAEEYLQRLEALHIAHFGSEAKFVAGNKLTHAGLKPFVHGFEVLSSI